MIFEFSLKRALSIAKKEKFHILRDPFTLAMATVLPVLLVLIFGLAIEFNVKDIGLGENFFLVETASGRSV